MKSEWRRERKNDCGEYPTAAEHGFTGGIAYDDLSIPLTSLSSRIFTNFCHLSLGSLDQIGALSNARESANSGASFLSGDMRTASSMKSSYKNFGTTKNIFLTSSTNDWKSFSENPAYFIMSPLTLGFCNSSRQNCGVSNFVPELRSFSASSTNAGFLENKNIMFVSATSRPIYNSPCLLATLAFNSSAIFMACSSVSLDFFDNAFNVLNETFSLTDLSKARINASLNESFHSLEESSIDLSYPFGTSNSIFIYTNCRNSLYSEPQAISDVFVGSHIARKEVIYPEIVFL